MLSNQSLEKLYTMIESDEGCRLKPYRCTQGFLTLGIGRNIDSKGISREEAMLMLKNDVAECVEALERLEFYYELNDVRKCVLVNMCFNLGVSGFMGFRKMIEALKIGHYDGAAKEIRESKAAKQTGNRYERLAYYMERGEW